MKTRFLSVLLTLLFVMTGFAGFAAEAGEAITIVLEIGSPTMTVNGEDLPIDEEGTAPVIVDGRTLLPVRALIEEMGGTVSWDGETREVTLEHEGDEIRLTIDSTEAYLNGEAQTLDTAPVIINGRTMLPIRFIAEGFEFDVAWDDETNRVTVTKAAAATEETVATVEEPTEEQSGSRSLVVYFSATGNTEALAGRIAEIVGADIYEIVPEDPYTSEDLDYSNDDCRANQEMNDENARPAISGTIENMDDYDTIYLGFPIWWGDMPRIINTFLESYDFSGKTILPFCTSGGSGISTAVSSIRSACESADVRDGMRGTASTGEAQIEQWLEENGIAAAEN